MSKMFEVELRYIIDAEAVNNIANIIKGHNFVKINDVYQEDIYYTSKYKDYIKSEECLRIRTVDNNSEITWKPPSDEKMQKTDFFWKEEIDLNIGNQRETAKYLLSNLDFIEYCTVKKHRVSYLHSSGIEISIDEVQGAGFFLELEIKNSNIDYAKKQLEEMTKLINLQQFKVSKTPYRDIVKPLL